MDEYQNLIPPPGVQVFRFQAPLYYANKDVFLRSLYKAVGVEPFLEMTKRRKNKKANGVSLKLGEVDEDKTNGEIVINLNGGLDFHTIVLDCSSIPFIDSTGATTFKGLFKEYKEIGVSVLLASCNTSVVDSLQKAQFFGKNDRDKSSLLFHTVHAAVLHANSSFGAADSSPDDSPL